jgi:hypothetical protein
MRPTDRPTVRLHPGKAPTALRRGRAKPSPSLPPSLPPVRGDKSPALGVSPGSFRQGGGAGGEVRTPQGPSTGASRWTGTCPRARGGAPPRLRFDLAAVPFGLAGWVSTPVPVTRGSGRGRAVPRRRAGGACGARCAQLGGDRPDGPEGRPGGRHRAPAPGLVSVPTSDTRVSRPSVAPPSGVHASHQQVPGRHPRLGYRWPGRIPYWVCVVASHPGMRRVTRFG